MHAAATASSSHRGACGARRGGGGGCDGASGRRTAPRRAPMRRDARLQQQLLVLVLLPLLLALLGLAGCGPAGATAKLRKIEARCSACGAIAKELEHRIAGEKPRNHLDMRHRLDEQGKRYGRVIDYKSSELRAVELLDKLCDDLGAALHVVNVSASGATTRVWWRHKEPADATWNSTRIKNAEQEKAKQKELQLFCGSIMEEYDEQIEEAIMAGRLNDAGSVAPVLCHEVLKACPDKTPPPTWIEEEAPATDAAEALAKTGAQGGDDNAHDSEKQDL